MVAGGVGETQAGRGLPDLVFVGGAADAGATGPNAKKSAAIADAAFAAGVGGADNCGCVTCAFSGADAQGHLATGDARRLEIVGIVNSGSPAPASLRESSWRPGLPSTVTMTDF